MRTIYLTLIGIGLLLFSGEGITQGWQLIWSGGWLAIIGFSAYMLNRLDKKEGKHGM